MKLIFFKILIGTSTLNFSSLSNFQVTEELLKMQRNDICGTDEPSFLFYKMYYMWCYWWYRQPCVLTRSNTWGPGVKKTSIICDVIRDVAGHVHQLYQTRERLKACASRRYSALVWANCKVGISLLILLSSMYSIPPYYSCTMLFSLL